MSYRSAVAGVEALKGSISAAAHDFFCCAATAAAVKTACRRGGAELPGFSCPSRASSPAR